MSDSLRVGLVCPYSFDRPGGVQNHIIGLAGWLRAHGHSVGILAPGRAEPGVLERAGVRAEDFTSAGPAFPVAYNGSVARINFGPSVALRVREWLADGYFDLVHLHEPMTPSVSLLVLGQTRLPVVVTFHTATPGSRAMELAYQVLPQAASRIDEAIAVSPAAAEVAERYSGLRCTVIGNGIDVASHPCAPCDGLWRGGQRPRITFIGRYDEPRKGLPVLLEALPAIRRLHPDLDVLVIGQGTHRTVPGVRFVGPLPDEQRNAVLASSDVYVAPQTGRESFGIVLLEAMASGAPVVASGLAAFRDVLTDVDGQIGEIFDVNDPDDLARAVLRSLARPRDDQLQRGRRRAEAFGWDALAPQILEVHHRAIAEAPPRASTRSLVHQALREGVAPARVSVARTRQLTHRRRLHRSPRLWP
ncbi:glycosyltransferase family 4 protein [Luteococcus sp. H138]|uniref:glycosyltransferase family 4 protein n=1 Tax=unclassified Luteococcus TaxID=2639923 RepID=UPI00313BEF6F